MLNTKYINKFEIQKIYVYEENNDFIDDELRFCECTIYIAR